MLQMTFQARLPAAPSACAAPSSPVARITTSPNCAASAAVPAFVPLPRSPASFSSFGSIARVAHEHLVTVLDEVAAECRGHVACAEESNVHACSVMAPLRAVLSVLAVGLGWLRLDNERRSCGCNERRNTSRGGAVPRRGRSSAAPPPGSCRSGRIATTNAGSTATSRHRAAVRGRLRLPLTRIARHAIYPLHRKHGVCLCCQARWRRNESARS
jgi:hypothetical protein